MRIDHLEVQNFLSYEHASLDLKPGLYFVAAENCVSGCSNSNGAGKSALVIDAPVWVLYGKTYREMLFGKTGDEWIKDDVVNRKHGKNCYGRIVFEVDGVSYGVKRYRKHDDFGNHVFLGNLIDDTCLTAESDIETDRKIEKLLGMGYVAFCNSVIFGQGPVKRFSQCSDADKRKIFESFFDLEVFNAARKIVMQDKAVIGEGLTAAEYKLNELNGLDQAYAEAAKQAQQQVDQFNKNLKEDKDRTLLHDAENFHATLSAEYEAKQDKLTQHDREMAAAKSKLQKIDVKKIRAELKDLGEDLNNKRHKSSQCEYQIEMLTKQRVVFRADHIECPTCLRKMTPKDIEALRDRLDKQILALREEDKQIDQQRIILSESMEKLSDLLSLADELTDNLESARMTRLNHVGDVDNAMLRMKSCWNEITQIKESMKGKKQQLRHYKKQCDAAADRCTDARNKVREQEKLISSLRVEMMDAELWLDGFGNYGVKNDCYAYGIASLNEHMATFLQQLTGGEIQASIDSESLEKIKLRVDIKDAANKYLLSSGGQAKRLDWCIALGLQSMVEHGRQKVNISVFDEFTDALDEIGRETMIEFLREEAKRKGTVFVISHNSDLAGYFDNVIRIVYKDGISSIVEP